MPSYRDQIPEDGFSLSLMIVPDEEDDGGSSFAFQEQDQVKVGRTASQQGILANPEVGCVFSGVMKIVSGYMFSMPVCHIRV